MTEKGGDKGGAEISLGRKWGGKGEIGNEKKRGNKGARKRWE